MNSITEMLKKRKRAVEYSAKHGVTAAAIRYRTCRQTIYNRAKKYDGTARSLADKSRRPH